MCVRSERTLKHISYYYKTLFYSRMYEYVRVLVQVVSIQRRVINYTIKLSKMNVEYY